MMDSISCQRCCRNSWICRGGGSRWEIRKRNFGALIIMDGMVDGWHHHLWMWWFALISFLEEGIIWRWSRDRWRFDRKERRIAFNFYFAWCLFTPCQMVLRMTLRVMSFSVMNMIGFFSPHSVSCVLKVMIGRMRRDDRIIFQFCTRMLLVMKSGWWFDHFGERRRNRIDEAISLRERSEGTQGRGWESMTKSRNRNGKK